MLTFALLLLAIVLVLSPFGKYILHKILDLLLTSVWFFIGVAIFIFMKKR